MSTMLYAFIFLAAIFILVIIYERKTKRYWTNKGVYSPPGLFFLGHLLDNSKPQPWEIINKIYRAGKNYKFIGLYEISKPKIMLTDPELIKLIAVKDFHHFVDRRMIITGHPKEDMSLDMLFKASTDKWKALRSAITPMFSSGKLKLLFNVIDKEAQTWQSYLTKYANSGESFDINDANRRYAINIMEVCIFGLGGRSLSGSSSEVLKIMEKFSDFNFIRSYKFVVYIISPVLFKLLGFHPIAACQLQMEAFSKKILQYRRDQGVVSKEDFIGFLMEAEKEAKIYKDGSYLLNDSGIISSCIVFIIAGVETIRHTVTWGIYKLAQFPEEQRNLRKELLQYATEDFDYSFIKKLKYMDAFILETLRHYPSLYMIERKCTKDYKIPNTNVIIPQGMAVNLPVYSLHHDPEYWEEPYQFRPSRFIHDNKKKINEYAFLPFGLGPRSCLGKRLGIMEVKVALAKLLLSFEISLKPGFTAQFSPAPDTMKPGKHGIQIVLKKINV